MFWFMKYIIIEIVYILKQEIDILYQFIKNFMILNKVQNYTLLLKFK